jgi:hypothetical protein
MLSTGRSQPVAAERSVGHHVAPLVGDGLSDLGQQPKERLPRRPIRLRHRVGEGPRDTDGTLVRGVGRPTEAGSGLPAR